MKYLIRSLIAISVVFLGVWLPACTPNVSTASDAGEIVDAGNQEVIPITTPPVIIRPPAPPDPRTPQQIAQAACGTRCKGAMTKPLVAVSGSQPILPPSWTVPTWHINPANSIGCASDTNSGTSASCTGGCSGSVCTSGIGPLLTYQELNVHRLGCQGNPTLCPRWRQSTSIIYDSSQTNATDVTKLR